MARCNRDGVNYKRHRYSHLVGAKGQRRRVFTRVCMACGAEKVAKARRKAAQ